MKKPEPMFPVDMFVYAKGNAVDGVTLRKATYNPDGNVGPEHQYNTEEGYILFRVSQWGAIEANPHDIGRWCTVHPNLEEAIRQAICRGQGK